MKYLRAEVIVPGQACQSIYVSTFRARETWLQLKTLSVKARVGIGDLEGRWLNWQARGLLQELPSMRRWHSGQAESPLIYGKLSQLLIDTQEEPMISFEDDLGFAAGN